MKLQSDQKLLNSFNKGDEAAFKTVYHRYRYRVYEYARKWLSETQDAEDVTADTFIKLWNKKHDFESFENITGFLLVTARNSCIDILRHQKKKAEKETEIQYQYSQYNDFSVLEIKEDFLKLIYAEVEKMPTKMKEVFLLSYAEGLKPQEIAQKLNLSVQTVSNQKTNAIKLLKQAFANRPALLLFVLLHFQK